MSLDILANYPGYEEFPIQQPPPGVVPNFDHPESTAWQVYTVAGICTFFLICVAAIRFHVKRNILKVQTKDDIAHYIAIALTIIYFMLIVALVHSGTYGVHSWDLKLGDFTPEYLRLGTALTFLYSPIIWMAKLPLFLMYIEVFGRIKWLRYSTWAVLIVTAMVFTAAGTGITIMCSPPAGTGQGQLDLLSALGSDACGKSIYFSYLQSAFTLGTDVFLLIVPMPIIWSLKLSTQRKIGISALILTGLVGSACSGLSIMYRIRTLIAERTQNSDSTWWSTPLWIVVECEMTCALIIAAAPSLACFCRKVIGPLASKLTTSHSRLLSSDKSSGRRTAGSGSSTSQLHGGSNEKIWRTREYSVDTNSSDSYHRHMDV